MRSQLDQAMADASTKQNEIQKRQARLMELRSELSQLDAPAKPDHVDTSPNAVKKKGGCHIA
jgi:hypothetical protein